MEPDDYLAVEEGPGRVTVEHEQHIPLPLIHVVQRNVAADLEESVLQWA